MMNWFQSREPRERVLLIILAALLTVFSAWFFLTRESGPSGQSELTAAQIDRELWLRAAPQLGTGASSTDRAEFTRGALIDVARRRGVDLSRMQPQSGGGLTVWIEDVGTAPLYGIINDLVAGYNVDVQTALITAGPNGMLSAQFTLNPL